MSDAAKSNEIEDVLSSIRRLVSETQPAPGDIAADAAETPEDEAGADRLVLTPALRVADPDDPWRPIQAEEPDKEAPLPEGMQDDAGAGAGAGADEARDDPEAVLAAIVGDAADSAGDEPDADRSGAWEPDAGFDDNIPTGEAFEGSDEPGPDTGSDAGPDLAGDDRDPGPALDDGADWAAQAWGADGDIADPMLSAETDLAARTEAAFEPEHGDTNWPDPAGADAALHIAAARGARGAPRGDEPDETGGNDTGGAEFRHARGDEAVFSHAHEDNSEDAAGLAAEDSGDDAAADDDTATDAADREDMAPEPGEMPGTADADAATAPPVFSRSAARDRVVDLGAEWSETRGDDGLEDDVEDLGDIADAFPGDEAGVLDEDALRDLIVEVVREELQGVLGQRITRNVRKMVRREIRLALAAEDLE